MTTEQPIPPEVQFLYEYAGKIIADGKSMIPQVEFFRENRREVYAFPLTQEEDKDALEEFIRQRVAANPNIDRIMLGMEAWATSPTGERLEVFFINLSNANGETMGFMAPIIREPGHHPQLGPLGVAQISNARGLASVTCSRVARGARSIDLSRSFPPSPLPARTL